MNVWEILTGATSVALRLSAYVFLQWIPGHHFPPLIVTLTFVYFALIYTKSHAFDHLKLHEAFSALFRQTEVVIVEAKDEAVMEVVEVDYDDHFPYEDEHPFWKTLLLGIPDWREREFTFVTAAFNLLLALLTLDLVFRGPLLNPANNLRFSRVGFVDHASAKLLFREPDSKQLPVYTYLKSKAETVYAEVDRAYYIAADTDYTHPVTLSSLIPETSYDYRLSNGLNGSFATAPAPGSPAATSLTFLTSSCIKANFPYRLFSNSLSIHGFEHLSTLLQSLPSPPAFMLFLGDFIYVDVPRRLSSTFGHYRSEYRRVYASPSWKLPGLSSVPWIHTLDDHEIANDWSGGSQTSPFPEASDPFTNYHVSVNPPIPPTPPSDPTSNITYFQFTRGPASFFMLDTRRYRTDPESPEPSVNNDNNESQRQNVKPGYGSSATSSNLPPPGQHPTMLGRPQLDALLTYLATPTPPGVHWKIITTSVPFTKNWRFGTTDTWGGFLTERTQILRAMHTAEATLGIRVIILSGDRHEFAAIRFPPPLLVTSPDDEATSISKGTTQYSVTPQSGPHEFSVGPLSMFYLPIRTFRQTDDEDVAIAYFPDGNSKVGAIEIRNLGPSSSSSFVAPPLFDAVRDSKVADFLSGIVGSALGSSGAGQAVRVKRGDATQKSLFRYTLWVDGKVEWEYTLTSPGLGS